MPAFWQSFEKVCEKLSGSSGSLRQVLIGEYSCGLPYHLMTFEERDQVDAERADAIRETVSSLPARPGTRR